MVRRITNLETSKDSLVAKDTELETKLNIVTTPKTISGEEHLTGEFYNDGTTTKEIYEITKTFTTGDAEGTDQETGIELSNTDKVWIDITNSYFINLDNLYLSINTPYDEYISCYYNSDNGKLMYKQKGFVRKQVVVTLRYTKVALAETNNN